MLLQRAIQELRDEYEAVGKGALFSTLLPWLMDEDTASQTEAAAQAGISVANFRVQLHRLRIRYRDAVQRQIADTLGGNGELAGEMAYFATISRGWM